MLRHRQRVNAHLNARQHIHQRQNVRFFRAIPDSAFPDVQRDLARDYRVNAIRSVRNTRTAARDNRVRIPFEVEDAQRVARQGFADYNLFQRDDLVYNDVSVYLHAMQGYIRQAVVQDWRRWRGIGIKLTIGIIYASNGGGGPDDEFTEHIASHIFYIFAYNELDDKIADMLSDIETRSLLFFEQGSDKVVVEIERKSVLKIWKQDRAPGILGGGDVQVWNGGGHIKLPSWIQGKRACINIQNKDELCFKYCLELAWRRKFNPDLIVKDSQRLAKWYFMDDKFDYTDVVFPVNFESVDQFESNNAEHQVCIRIFIPREDLNRSFSIVRDCEHLIHQYENPWVIQLLLISNEEQTSFHYVYIKEDGLWLLTRSHLAKTKESRYGCIRCLRDFNSEASLAHHIDFQCLDNHYRKPELPEKERAQKYFANMKQFNVKPFVIVYDFEAVNEKVQHPNPEEESKTQASKRTVHIPVSMGIYAVCPSMPELNVGPYIYTVTTPTRASEDLPVNRTTIMFQFHEWLYQHVEYFKECINTYFSFPFSGADTMTEEQKQNYNESTECCICNLNLQDGTMPHWAWKVPDDFDMGNMDKGAVYAGLMIFDETHKNYRWGKGLRARVMFNNRLKNYAWDPYKQEQNYVGAAHNICTRDIGKYGPIPCLAHNATGYDNHMVIQGFRPMRYREVGKRNKDIFNCISAESDRFKTFTLNNTYQFLDSYAYLKDPLDRLVENTVKDGYDKLPITQCELEHYMVQEFGISIKADPSLLVTLLKKQAYPYEWLDSPTKLLTNGPTEWQAFRSSLRGDNEESDNRIQTNDWPKFKNMWAVLSKHKPIKMLDYHNFYLFMDVVLLADIVMNYRRQCKLDSGLEALASPTLPGYTETHMLLYNTLSQPSPRTDPFFIHLLHKGQEDMYTMFEEGIRGGLSIAPGRYAKANNKYLEDYDDEEPTSYILYLDMTNLYGAAMCMPLPYSDFEWVVPEDPELNLLEHWQEVGQDLDADSPIGFVYEIDGYFPEECHDYLKDLPPLPHKQAVDIAMTSEYYKGIMDQYGLKHDNRTKKLLGSLLPRFNYLTHYRNLQQAQELGFIVTKVHRIATFTQKAWCKDYVQYNTNSRKIATTIEAKNYFKLKVNAGYGKMIQNTRKFKKVEMRMTDQKLTPNQFERGEVQHMNDQFNLVTMEQDTVKLNSPVHAGFAILEMSKLLMYDFFYNKLKRVFADNMKLLFMDTDSLCIHFQCEDVMETFREHDLLQYFDMSDWPKEQGTYYTESYYDPVNKKVPGTMKDEMAEEKHHIKEVVALKSKMYSVLKHDDKQKATAKGVPEHIKRRILTHAAYKECLYMMGDYADGQLPKVTMHNIRSEKNSMTTRAMNKMALNPCDAKCFMLDAYTTVPYGHYQATTQLAIDNPLQQYQ